MSSDGVMEIKAVQEADLKAIDWNKVINMPAYKLYIEVRCWLPFWQAPIIISNDRSSFRISAHIPVTISSTVNIRGHYTFKFSTAMAVQAILWRERCWSKHVIICILHIHNNFFFLHYWCDLLSVRDFPAVIMYTSAKPVKITNSAASWSMTVGFEIYESPIKQYYTNITTSNAIDISGRVWALARERAKLRNS